MSTSTTKQQEIKKPAGGKEAQANSIAGGRLMRFGLTLSNWSERWFPDPLVFALVGVVLVFLFGVCIGQKPHKQFCW